MIKIKMAFPAVVLLLTLSISSAGQTYLETPGAPVAPRVAQSKPQSPAESSVIVVKPGLTDEQLADLYMARKDYREAALSYKRLADQNPRNPVYLNKLGIALHQQAALGAALKYYERASKVDPSYADAQNNIGTIWYQRKKYVRAIRPIKKRSIFVAIWPSSTATLAMPTLATKNTSRPSPRSVRRWRWIRSSSIITARGAGRFCRTDPWVTGGDSISCSQSRSRKRVTSSAASSTFEKPKTKVTKSCLPRNPIPLLQQS